MADHSKTERHSRNKRPSTIRIPNAFGIRAPTVSGYPWTLFWLKSYRLDTGNLLIPFQLPITNNSCNNNTNSVKSLRFHLWWETFLSSNLRSKSKWILWRPKGYFCTFFIDYKIYLRFRFEWRRFAIQRGSEYLPHKCNGSDVELNRTTSMPKSVLHYVLDKGQNFNLESFLKPIFVSQIKWLIVKGEFYYLR